MSIIQINRRELSRQEAFISQICGYSIMYPPTICYDPSILYCPPAHTQEVLYAIH